MPSCLARRKDHTDWLWLHLGWVVAAHMQITAKVRASVRGVVGSRPAVLDVAARLPIAILVGTVVHTSVVHMCRRGRCAQKHAEHKPPALHDMRSGLGGRTRGSWMNFQGAGVSPIGTSMSTGP